MSEESKANATASTAQTRPLPTELLYLVVEGVLPSNPDLLLPASHLSTKTLLALTLVCRDTYGLATRLLRQRCLHIETKDRLERLLLCVPRFVPTLPAAPSLRNITSLYLAPFEDKLDDLPTAAMVRDLFSEVSESLRRLVVHMPFQSLDPLADPRGIRRTLREGFELLHGLEEFVSLGDYPALSVSDGPTDVWRLWPGLRRLTLFGAPADSHWLWWDIATLPHLRHVVLARTLNVAGANIKDEYFHKLPRGDARLDRRIKVLLVDVGIAWRGVDTARWDEVDPGRRMSVQLYDVPTSYYGDEVPQELVTAWVKRGALDGSLWEWCGEEAE